MKNNDGVLRVALMGNPNTGKTTLFNRLTGFKARVGNYSGVTVERRIAPIKGLSRRVDLIDLPGTYSIAARSPDEMVAVDVLLGQRVEDPLAPDAVLIVADASNLARNLFLATQVMETGFPFALLLNMTDMAEANGVRVDHVLLAEKLGAPVFPVIGTKGTGVDAVCSWLNAGSWRNSNQGSWLEFPEVFEKALHALEEQLAHSGIPSRDRVKFLLRRSLLETGGMSERRLVADNGATTATLLNEARAQVEAAGLNLISLEAQTRYGAIRRLLDGVCHIPEGRRESPSDRIDRVVLQPVWGTLIFLTLMLLIFQAIYAWSSPFMDIIDGSFSRLAGWVKSSLPEGPLASFLSDGAITGVGGVLVFLPQILILFLFIAILEDCGYLARAAFLADRVFSRIGLSGRSFIPLIGSFACAIPSVMATRTIADRRERFVTIMVAPLMSCSARLPVYALMIAAFVPSLRIGGFLNVQGLVLLLMYLVGPAAAVVVALVLRRTLLKGPKPVFLMELPPYRWPDARVVLHRLLERAGLFIRKAGTVILAVSLIIWAASYYPRPSSVAAGIESEFAERFESAVGEEAKSARETERDQAVAAAYLQQSFLGRAGHLIEPLVAPLGWDWRIGMAVVASFPAREVVVATLGVIFDAGEEVADDDRLLQSRLQAATRADGTPLFTLPVAFSIMVFFALCAQCAATLAVIKRETNSWLWPLFSFTYMTALAWIGAFATYHVVAWILG